MNMGYQKTVKTSPSTTKTAKSPAKMVSKFGNAGNTKGTRLPDGGCPKGSKAKKGMKY